MLTVIVPALNEEATIGSVIQGLQHALEKIKGVKFQVLVADNGSEDATAARAKAAGARVVAARPKGYGSACLAALACNPFPEGLICFVDGDGADDPSDLESILRPLLEGEADLVIGSRMLGMERGWVAPGALTPVQAFGNRLTAFLLEKTWGTACTDLGPFRAIKASALARLEMDDPNWGWTVQMQARAARMGLSVHEVPVHYRVRQGGTSKISGTVRGSIAAGTVILKTYLTSLFWRPRAQK